MEDSSAASPAPVEAAAAPNPATEAPAASLPAPEAGPEASALPAGATVAPPRFDLHAAPDANLNLRLSQSEDGWGGALPAWLKGFAIGLGCGGATSGRGGTLCKGRGCALCT